MGMHGDPKSPGANPAAGPDGASWIAIAFGLTSLVVLAAVILGAVLASRLFSGFDVGRKHLRAIPIAAGACPYVRVMHAAANEVQRDEPIPALDLVTGGASQPLTLTWPRSRARFGSALGVLELAILVSNTHFPRAVRDHLGVTLTDVRTGRALLSRQTDAELATRYSDLFGDGQQAFGEAGDLIGRQCGVQLGADSATMPSAPLVIINEPSTTDPQAPSPSGANVPSTA